jgi:predicted 3-demethylubiquinone-9 3-methyltransferase (glyoxalase superfamily)
MSSSTPKITPFLWFDNNLEQALNFYASIFKNAKIGNISRFPEGSPGAEAGDVMTASFELEGQKFLALSGGPMFKFTEAVSFFVNCDSQEEVDHYWNKLSEGGQESRCGWLKDKFGLSWQIIPTALGELMGDKDPAKAKRVMMAMLQMDKIIIADLQIAYVNN